MNLLRHFLSAFLGTVGVLMVAVAEAIGVGVTMWAVFRILEQRR